MLAATSCSALADKYRHLPDCYYDARYTGSVCKPNYNVVTMGFSADKPCGPCFHPSIRLSYRDAEGIYVKPTDTAYLRGKWRPEGSFNLVGLDMDTDQMQLRIIGEHDEEYQGSWTRATATWLSRRRLSATFYYDTRCTSRGRAFEADGVWLRGRALSGWEHA